MKFCRINLVETDYDIMPASRWGYIREKDVSSLDQIYKSYCKFKNFDSVMPIFDSQYLDESIDIIGYYDNENLVAWDMIKVYDNENVEALQFAWNYENPNLRLGIESLKNACAIYKQRGFKYLYLGLTANYKKEIKGYQELGPA